MDQTHTSPATWIVSELFYPEETSTGYILTALAEGLAAKHRVRVVCGQPSYAARGVRAPAREVYHAIEIQRCWGTTWNKDRLLARVANLITLSLSILVWLLVRLRRHDQVLVVTNPPLLPFLVAWACRVKRARCLLLVHDVYPEAAIAAGLLRDQSLTVRIMDFWVRRLYRSVDRIITLGRDMQQLVRSKLETGHDKVVIITNWSDADQVRPECRATNRLLQQLGISGKFVVLYAGNMGRSHDVEGICACAQALAHDDSVHFLLVGSGAKKAWLERRVAGKRLGNVTVLDRRPQAELSTLLNAADVATITFVARMQGVSVPCRLYNFLAAGKPIIAVCDPEAELAHVVNEERVGWVVPPRDVPAFVNAVLAARRDPVELSNMSQRARSVAVTKYRLNQILAQFSDLLDSTQATPPTSTHANCSMTPICTASIAD